MVMLVLISAVTLSPMANVTGLWSIVFGSSEISMTGFEGSDKNDLMLT